MMIDLTSKLEEINYDKEHNKGSKIYPQNQIIHKSENATLQLSLSYKKVLDKKYLLKLNNVAQTFSKRFVETQLICLV